MILKECYRFLILSALVAVDTEIDSNSSFDFRLISENNDIGMRSQWWKSWDQPDIISLNEDEVATQFKW